MKKNLTLILMFFVALLWSQCPVGSTIITGTGNKTVLSGTTACIDSDINIGSLTVQQNATLIIQPGVKLTGTGTIIVRGTLDMLAGSIVEYTGSANVGAGGNYDSLLQLATGASFSITGSLTVNANATGRTSLIKQGAGSVVEACSTYSQFYDNAVIYTGTASSFAYFIVKAQSSGSGSTPITQYSQIRFIEMNTLTNITTGSATYCGPNATSATCPTIWPVGLSNSISDCHLAGTIVSNLNLCTPPTITGTTSVCISGTTQLTGSGTAATTNPWTSSNTAVATVSSTGLVTGVSAGTSTISYTDSNGCTNTATITVNALPTITGTTSVCINGTTQLTGSGTAATTNPWTSSNTAVATVSSTGLITGVSAGTSTITYTNNNGCSTTTTVTVNALPTITGTVFVCIGASTPLTGSGTAATTNPWTSSNTAVATVSSTGLVTGVSAGTSNITYTNNAGCARMVTVTVNNCALLDSDGDGILDIDDIDDDNDGILDIVECPNCTSDPFANGGFESPIVGSAGYYLGSVPNWSTTATDGKIEVWKTGHDGVSAAEGTQFAELNANQVSTLYQTFCVPDLGGTLNWSLKHRGRLGTDVAEVRIGTSLTSYTVVATLTDGNTTWGSYSGSVSIPASAPGTYYIMFSSVSAAGGDNTYGNFLDDIKIIITPNCVDTDGDGISDKLDLDSDNDGCPDAIEGGANILASQLVDAVGTLQGGNGINPAIPPTSGTYNQAVLKNLCASNTCVNAQGLPQFSPTVPTNYSNTTGQTRDIAYNSSIVSNACKCFKTGATGGTVLDTNHGITVLGRAGADNGNWPMVRKGAWTALEAKSKGFVINRIPTTAQVNAIANPVEGMMVYDDEADCLKIYTKDNDPATSYSWRCFNNQTCPDIL